MGIPCVNRHAGLWWGVAMAAALLVLSSAPTPVLAARPPITGQMITDAVEEELLHDQAVLSAYIDVQTADGIVTLSGTVNNLIAKERAARVAETVKGVRAVVNTLTVQVAHDVPDETLRQDVVRALQGDPVADLQEITVHVADGVVTLRGTVQSWVEKQAAARVVSGVKGVKEIENTLGIRHPTRRSEAEIEADIEHRLRWDVLVDHALIDVEVQDGKVRLTGVVGSAAEKRMAIADAGVAGVTEIDASGLEVRMWAREPELRQHKYVVKSDEELRQAIEAAFRVAPRVQAYRVVPEVEDGVVTLRGTVDTLHAKRAAAQVARHTVGVARVKNRLKVRTADTPIRGDTLAADIRGALTRDAYVSRYGITVEVVDGIAYLSGTVNSYFEKARAEEVASRVRGIVGVQNNLRLLGSSAPLVYDPYVDEEWHPEDYRWYDYAPQATLQRDAAIAQEIREELWWSPFVDTDEVRVHVVNGVATLTGTVDSEVARRAATENAYEGGAIRVVNELKVE